MSRKHSNPYRINDDRDIFEVTENSSHPELQDARRLWHFGGYTFKTATELKKFFEQEGLDPKQYWIAPKIDKELAGKIIIHIHVRPRWQLNKEQMERAKRLDQAV